MELNERISEWVDAHERELLTDIARLVAVRSVKGEPEADAPFGAGPRAALDVALRMCEGYGFATACYGGAVGTADLNSLPSGLDILAHLDVVGEGDGWETDPYSAVVHDGCLFGRGTDDDKGPAVMALYALRCVKELGIPMKSGCRLILGTDEESGSGDLPYYYREHAPAPCTFSPDAGFPVYNVEKGGYKPTLRSEWVKSSALPRVSVLHGGFRINVIPSDAEATVLGMDEAELLRLAAPEAERCGVSLRTEPVPGGAKIAVHGVQAHAASPWEGNNGVTALCSILAKLPLAECGSTAALRAVSALLPHGDWRGEAAGIAQKDEISGELTASFNLLDLDEGGLRGQIDCRVPVCANEENCKKAAEKRFSERGIELDGRMQKPHHTPGEGEFVQTLLRCYETYSGRKGECRYMGGGTYVHDIEGGVAFGAGMPDFDSHLHGANERISIRDTLCATKIFALSIAQICGK